ncbi:SRPBCC family protein, partial [Thermodesulfobacteriota bacterium]
KAKKSIRIKASLEDVYNYLLDVSKSSECYDNLESVEKVDDETYRWLMKEKDYGPLKFQVRYVLTYASNDVDCISWKSTGEGNTDVDGEVVLKAVGDGATEVTVTNNLASDIPIPRLMKAVAKPMATKELERTIDTYLKNLKATLE